MFFLGSEGVHQQESGSLGMGAELLFSQTLFQNNLGAKLHVFETISTLVCPSFGYAYNTENSFAFGDFSQI